MMAMVSMEAVTDHGAAGDSDSEQNGSDTGSDDDADDDDRHDHPHRRHRHSSSGGEQIEYCCPISSYPPRFADFSGCDRDRMRMSSSKCC